MVAKYQQGPVGMLTILPNGVPAMGKSLVLWLLYTVVISVFVGYLATMGLDRAAQRPCWCFASHDRSTTGVWCPPPARCHLERTVLDHDPEVHAGRRDLQPRDRRSL